MSTTQEHDQGKSPQAIRADIEQTREELGDTVEALAAKTDIKAQAKNRITQVKQTAQHRKDEFASRAREATPDSASAGAEQIVSTVKNRPLLFTAVAAYRGRSPGRLAARPGLATAMRERSYLQEVDRGPEQPWPGHPTNLPRRAGPRGVQANARRVQGPNNLGDLAAALTIRRALRSSRY